MDLNQKLAKLQPILDKLPPEHKRAIAEALEAVKASADRQKASIDFMAFVKKVWPNFIEGAHHRIMADAFEKIADGRLKRLIINLPPRHSKSELSSYLLPAWFIGRYPGKKIIQATHTAELSVGFGRKVRNLIDEDSYKSVFPGVKLSSDSKAAGRWETNSGGEAYYLGVGGAMTGRGADLLIIDDPHAGDQMGNDPMPADFEKAYEWYTSGPRQRLQPKGAIALIMTRWGEGDLCGKILRAAKERDGTDQWHVINFPALNDKDEPLWPQFWSKEELLAIRAEIPSHKWSSQYQQDPVAQGAAIVKREWVRWWEEQDPPHCEYLILSIDPAHTTSNRADYSAFTVWGIFEIEGEDGLPVKNLILLDAVNERLEFPDLKQRTLELYQYWTPDITIVEAKAAGLPLVQELRSTGVPLQSFTPSRGNDKITRVNSIADIFSSGLVWMPRRSWSEKVVDQYVAFPFGDHDDLVDSATMALMYYRKTASIRLPADYVDPDESKLYRRIPEYY